MSVNLNQAISEFTAQSTQGDISLAKYRGKNVVLYFYPKDNTPGCTTESVSFRDHYAQFQAANTEIIGLSRDSLKSHQKFLADFDLPFALIADTEEALCQYFDVMKAKKMYGKDVRGIERSTFLIDSKGVLRNEWRGVKVVGHVEEVLKAAQALA